MSAKTAKFNVGQVVHHRRFDYRGAVYDVDPNFQGEDEWYEAVAATRPPKDKPWYHVLVDGSDQTTYVAERNLENEPSGEPIRHPLVEEVFSSFEDGAYVFQRPLS